MRHAKVLWYVATLVFPSVDIIVISWLIWVFFFVSPMVVFVCVFFFSSRRRHTRSLCDWSSDVCSSDLDAVRRVALEDLAVGGDGPIEVLDHVLLDGGDAAEVVAAVAALGVGADRFIGGGPRSEERRVGKEGRSRGAPEQ